MHGMSWGGQDLFAAYRIECESGTSEKMGAWESPRVSANGVLILDHARYEVRGSCTGVYEAYEWDPLSDCGERWLT